MTWQLISDWLGLLRCQSLIAKTTATRTADPAANNPGRAPVNADHPGTDHHLAATEAVAGAGAAFPAAQGPLTVQPYLQRFDLGDPVAMREVAWLVYSLTSLEKRASVQSVCLLPCAAELLSCYTRDSTCSGCSAGGCQVASQSPPGPCVLDRLSVHAPVLCCLPQRKQSS